MWVPASGSNCREKYVGVVDGTAIIIGILIAINLATFVKLYLFYKSTELDSRDIKLKMRKNRTMFMQTILQDMAYLIDVIFTFQLSDLFVSRIWTFISGSFIWQCVHSLDGLIMIMFNERFTFLKRSLFTSSSNPSVVQPNNAVGTTTTPTTTTRTHPAQVQ
ncbi:unnamed protein product [Caenorhabditis nigoni]